MLTSRTPTTAARQDDRRNGFRASSRRRRGWSLAATLLVGAGSVLVGCESARVPIELPPLPEQRHGHRAEFLADGRLLVIGGFDDADRSGDRGGRTTWIFDPAAGAWSRAGDLHEPMHFHGSTSFEGRIYAVGGDVEVFDADRATWTSLVPGDSMPRTHFAAAAMRTSTGPSILAAGGFQNVIADLATGSLRKLPDYPQRTEQDHFSLVGVFDGVLHIAGGYTGEDYHLGTAHWAWDGVEWSARAPIPRPLAAKFVAWCAEPETARLYAFDEEGGLLYDARADAWSTLPKPPWTGYIAMPACAMRDGFLYVMGGQVADGGTGGNCVFDARAGEWVRR